MKEARSVNFKKERLPNQNNLKTNASHSVTVIEALNGEINGESVLPTFTCTIAGKAKVRGLKDGGCQSKCITADLANSLKLKVIDDNVKLTVNGFNTSKQYITNLVEAKIKFGDKEHIINALCIPSINMSLNLPKLSKVVSGFLHKGYKLADEKLTVSSDQISGLDLILGTKGAFCIPVSDVLFGKDQRSVYSETPMGIIIKGDIDQILTDIASLPSRVNSSIDTSCIDDGPIQSLNSSGETVSSFAGLGKSSLSCSRDVKADSSEGVSNYFVRVDRYSILNDHGVVCEKKVMTGH